jgi:hypothetical protein
MITTNYSLENFSEQNEFNHASLMILGIASVVVLGSFLAGCIHWCWKKSEPKVPDTPELTRVSRNSEFMIDNARPSPLDSTNIDTLNHQGIDTASSFSSFSSTFSSSSTPESMRVNKVSSIFNATQSNSFKFVENRGDSNDSNNSKRVQFSELQISEFQMYR